MEKGAALPKNIRQIGEISGREKICVEDYVMTYIQKKERQEDRGFLGIFLGEQQETEDSVYVFIRGIFEVPEEVQGQQEQQAFLEECKNYFGDWSVQGCCVIGRYPTERMKALASWIPEAGRLIYHLQEQEETLYWTDREQYRRLQGYFVFYEQNRRMQEYLAQMFREESVEKESTPDRAIHSFREKVKEKGEQKRGSFLRMASSFFVITILIIGAIVVNRIEDIRAVRRLSGTGDETPVYGSEEGERVLSSAVSGNAAWQAAEEITERDGSSAETAQYGVSGQDAEEAALPGPEVFWEESGFEDESEDADAPVTGALAETGNSDSVPAGTDGADIPAGTDSADIPAGASDAETPAGTDSTDIPAGAGDAETPAGTDSVDTSAGVSDAETPAGTGDKASPAVETISASSDGTDIVNPAGTDAAADNGRGAEQEDAEEAAALRHLQAGYVIREGDTLAAICSRYYGSMDRIEEVCKANGIADANMILPGQRIVLP